MIQIKLERVHFSYILAGAVISKLFIDPKYLDFENDLTSSIVVFTSITSLIASLLIILSIQKLFTSILLFILEKIEQDERYDLKREIALKNYFSSTLGYSWGNFCLLFLITLIILTYVFNFTTLYFPFINTKLNHIVVILLLLVFLFIAFDFINGVRDFVERLNMCYFFEYFYSLKYQELDKEYHKRSSGLGAKKRITKEWLQKNGEYINYRWDLLKKNYDEQIEEMKKDLERLSEELPKIISEYQDETALPKKEDLHLDPKPSGMGASLERIINCIAPKYLSNIEQIERIYWSLKINGMDAILHPEKLNTLTLDKMINVNDKHNELLRKFNRLSARNYLYDFEDEIKVHQLKDFQILYTLSQFDQTNPLLKYILGIFSEERNKYERVFLPNVEKILLDPKDIREGEPKTLKEYVYNIVTIKEELNEIYRGIDRSYIIKTKEAIENINRCLKY